MFEQVMYPKSLAPEMLDQLLAKGWFRMGQSIFTTEYTLFDHRMYQTIWLRHVLKDYHETKTIRNLKKRNKAFRLELKKVEITSTHEDLFSRYKGSVYFNTASSLNQLLNGYVIEEAQIFNTYEINVYDKNKLIACSYFDIGKKSAEGISSYYDPEYEKYSLGKYMIYLQIDVCRGNGFDFYYPGYFVPGFAHLDYKLAIGSDSLEFFSVEDFCWYPIAEYEPFGIPLHFQLYFGG